MDIETIIREKLAKLYRTDPHIHVSVHMTRPKRAMENIEATLVGVYAHIFQIEECTSGRPQRHTLQYADVITNQIEIAELKRNTDHTEGKK